MTRAAVTPAMILTAANRIGGTLAATPQSHAARLSELTGHPVEIKWECRQRTGSFKLRGALNAIAGLDEAARRRGVVGVSTGNHGRGLAYAARAAGVRCVICMSSLVPANKIDGITALGAEVDIVGRSQDEARHRVDQLVAEDGLVMLPPFDHPDIIAGQGTLALEMLAGMPSAELLAVPLSGGGLISGIAVMAKALRPDIRIVGVSMARGAAMYESQRAGHPVPVTELPTLADSLGGGIGLDNRYTFALVRDLVDDIIVLDEAEIAAGIRHAHAAEQEVVEGGGAVCLGAVLAGKIRPGGPAILLASGRNIDMDLHRRIVNGEMPEREGG